MESVLGKYHSSSNVMLPGQEYPLNQNENISYSQSIRTRIELFIHILRNLGESYYSFVEECDNLRDSFTREFAQSAYSSRLILKTIRSLIIEQPNKQPYIAFLLIHIEEDNIHISNTIIEYLLREFQQQLDLTSNNNEIDKFGAETWTNVKMYTRFFSLISPIINLGSIIFHYKNILKLACEMNKKNVILANLILESVLKNIPFLFYFNRQNKILQFEIINLINVMEVDFTTKHNNLGLVRPYYYENLEICNENQVTVSQMKKLLHNGLDKFNKIFPKWTITISDLFSKNIKKQWKLQYPTVKRILTFKEIETNHSWTGIITDSYPYQDYKIQFERTSGHLNKSEIETSSKLIVPDNITDVMHKLEFNKIEGCKTLMQLYNYFQNICSDSNQDKSKKNVYYTVIQTIVSMLLRLPYSIIPTLYYSLVLQEFCRQSPKQFSTIIGKHFRFIHMNLCTSDCKTTLEYEKSHRFQLINFDYKCKCEQLIVDYTTCHLYPYNSKTFLHVNIIKGLASSTPNLQELKMSLSLIFQNILRNKYFDNYSMALYMNHQFNHGNNSFNFEDVGLLCPQDSFPFHETILRILHCTHVYNNDGSKSNRNELVHLVSNIETNNSGFFKNFEVLRVIILIQYICHSGRRSLSNANNYIEVLGDRVFEILEKVKIKSSNLQFIVTGSIIRYWNKNTSTRFLLLNSFKQSDLISDLVVIEFSFYDVNQELKLLISYGAREYFPETLDENIQCAADSKYYIFLRSYKLAMKIISDSLNEMEIKDDTIIAHPELFDAEDAPNDYANDKWKYLEDVKLIKCVFRKFYCIYRKISGILFSILLQINLMHFQTIEGIAAWIKECQILS